MPDKDSRLGQPLNTGPEYARMLRRRAASPRQDGQDIVELTGTEAYEVSVALEASDIAGSELCELLFRHGNHTDGCTYRTKGECDCGWDQLKWRLRKAKQVAS